MSVYIDDLATYHTEQIKKEARKLGKRWCHMWADDEKELHAMATKIGLKREWFQQGSLLQHYDLVPTKRIEALKAGAVKKSLKEWFKGRRNKL